jgi:hypothetical protein
LSLNNKDICEKIAYNLEQADRYEKKGDFVLAVLYCAKARALQRVLDKREGERSDVYSGSYAVVDWEKINKTFWEEC